jgi:exonuclease VII small subunit
MQPNVIRRPVGLYVAIALASFIVIVLVIILFFAFDSLQQTRFELKTQQTETRQYEQLSIRYSTQLDEKTTQLEQVNALLDTVEYDLEEMTVQYENASREIEKTTTNLQSANSNLERVQKELELYKETWGSVVASGVEPPFKNINIINQTTAVNTTWDRVQSFILADDTDRNLYISDVYVCGEFASDVHNNAELAGIRCALVAIEFSNGWHACNAFKTTDRGLVFVDCTGVRDGCGPYNCDKTVIVKLADDYIPVSMVPQPGWQTTWENMGMILDVQIYW